MANPFLSIEMLAEQAINLGVLLIAVVFLFGLVCEFGLALGELVAEFRRQRRDAA